MKKNPQRLLSFIAVVTLLTCNLSAQPVERTIGLLQTSADTSSGYFLLAPNVYPFTYLIDNNGMVVHSWNCGSLLRYSSYLREDGLLLRAATGGSEFGFNSPGAGGLIQLLDWDGTIVWEYTYADSTYRHHHDIEPLPNGNILVLAWERKTPHEQLDAGRDSTLVASTLWSERIAEIKPIYPDSAEIVWIWYAWDHLIQEYDSTKSNYEVISDHPELIDLNYASRGTNSDWLHFNTVNYNAGLDQIVLSPLFNNEIWIIDHSTTIGEAAGHSGGNSGKGGDLLYRWGNPQTYGYGGEPDLKLFGSHDAQLIWDSSSSEWKILLFHNGNGRPGGNYSSADELTLPIDTNQFYYRHPDSAFGPPDFSWHYEATPPESLYSGAMSGVNRMNNGNTVICSAIRGEIYEVTQAGDVAWRYKNPVTISGPQAQGTVLGPNSSTVFKARKYSPEYAGLNGQDLTPTGPIETYCCVAIRGDANADGIDANILDLNYLVNYTFRASVPRPDCFDEGDVNGDGNVNSPNILDLNFLVNYIFRLGPAPGACNYGP